MGERCRLHIYCHMGFKIFSIHLKIYLSFSYNRKTSQLRTSLFLKKLLSSLLNQGSLKQCFFKIAQWRLLADIPSTLVIILSSLRTKLLRTLMKNSNLTSKTKILGSPWALCFILVFSDKIRWASCENNVKLLKHMNN